MFKVSKLLLALFATVVVVQPAMARNHRNWSQWQNQASYASYSPNPYCQPSPYVNGVQTSNGSWVDGSIGANGNPAWMGGYRGR